MLNLDAQFGYSDFEFDDGDQAVTKKLKGRDTIRRGL